MKKQGDQQKYSPSTNELVEAYKKARYVVNAEEKNRCIRVGKGYSWMDKLLAAHGTQQAIFITAYNPCSLLKSTAENTAANNRLEALLQAEKYAYVKGYSGDDKNCWPQEISFLVFDIQPEVADRLAKQFNQKGYLIIEVNQPVALRYFDMRGNPFVISENRAD